MKIIICILLVIATLSVKAQKIDTSRILLEMVDTSELERPHSTMGYLYPLSQASNEGRIVFWDWGYEVKEERSMEEINPYNWDCVNCPHTYWKFIGYLDRNKKPLRKGLYVLPHL